MLYVSNLFLSIQSPHFHHHHRLIRVIGNGMIAPSVSCIKKNIPEMSTSGY